ncbi:MAG: IS5 family transposase, partial [Flavobacteriales bacterium]
MLGRNDDKEQRDLFHPALEDFIDPEHPLVRMAERIDWGALESEFEGLYSATGRPSKPVRLMAGLLILKRTEDLSDEEVVARWVRDPYYQYFCGETHFQWEFPCEPSELVHFRQRIGEEGVERIFRLSVDLNDDDADKDELIVDSTAQLKDITFPTDAKLAQKIAERCWAVRDKEGVQLRQSYTRTVKQLMKDQHFGHHPKRKKKAIKARKRLQTIAGRLIRDLRRKLPEERLSEYEEQFTFYEQILSQKKHDTQKIYSLHEPHVACIAKGKAHPKYEFGSKVSFAITPGTNVIVGVKNFTGNPHDSKTLEPTIEHAEDVLGRTSFREVTGDRGYRGKSWVRGARINTPHNSKGRTPYEKRKYRKKFRRRAGIEPLIGHVKHDHRMARNYLKGEVGDSINAMMAAAGFNFRKALAKVAEDVFVLLRKWLSTFHVRTEALSLAPVS